MSRMTAAPGVVVISKAGRDTGRCFVVVRPADEDHVWVVDGVLRTLERPKKKKLRHLRICPHVAEEIESAFLAGQPVLDSDVRRALKVFKGSI